VQHCSFSHVMIYCNRWSGLQWRRAQDVWQRSNTSSCD